MCSKGARERPDSAVPVRHRTPHRVELMRTDVAAHAGRSGLKTSVGQTRLSVAPLTSRHLYVEALVALDRLATPLVTPLTARRLLEALLAFALQSA